MSALTAEVKQLRAGIEQVARQNRQLAEQLQAQSQELEKIRDALVQTQASQPAEAAMSVERMKQELEQPLKDAIRAVKQRLETPRKGNQFGVRMAYEPAKAIYGLVRTRDPAAPFQAKVLVPYEKFLESENESRSYGKSVTEFLFSWSKGKWKLELAEPDSPQTQAP